MSILKDKILKDKKKLLITTGAVVAAITLAVGGSLAYDAAQETKAIEGYAIISQLEQEDFKRSVVANESFEDLLNRFGFDVTQNTKSLSPDMEKIYQMYSLVWNAEYKGIDCQEQIEAKISEFQEVLLRLAELRIPGKVKDVSDKKIEAEGKVESATKFISPEAYIRNWAYSGAELDESKGGYIWTYEIYPKYIMTCEDADLLFLLKATKEDAKFFTNKNILKSISAYIRVLGNEYQFIYDKTSEGMIHEWVEIQTITYKGTIVNVSKTNDKSKKELLNQLANFKKHLLERYEKEGIKPEDCRVSKLEEKWYLIINSTNEKIELNENYAIICEKIVAIQNILKDIDTEDYTESIVAEEDSPIMSYDVNTALDDITNLYLYSK